MIWYYYGNGKRIKGKIRICKGCKREDLVTIYNLKELCKLCGSRNRKDIVRDDEVYLEQKNGRMRAEKINCESCGIELIVRKSSNRKNEMCQPCTVRRVYSALGKGKFGKLNNAYKNGIGTYRQRGLIKNGGCCTVCESVDKIEVHHIDKKRTNNDESNLMPLCKRCHESIHMNLDKGISHDEAFKEVLKFKEIL